jgi:hypothetical protein
MWRAFTALANGYTHVKRRRNIPQAAVPPAVGPTGPGTGSVSGCRQDLNGGNFFFTVTPLRRTYTGRPFL